MKKILLLLPLLAILFAFNSLTDIIITGTVTDQNGQPIPFASVVIKGTTKGVQANVDGKFSLQITNSSSTVLVFSAAGFQPVEMPVGNHKILHVKLPVMANTLQEVVVVHAYGTKRQARSTAANIQSVQSQSLLRGQVSGLQISTTNSGYDDEENFNNEEYSSISENQFHSSKETPLSTFSIDVDGASYSNVRRYLSSGQLPPLDAVRTEEFVNYFKYQYPQPRGNDPFSINTEIADCPWNKDHKIALIGLQGKNIPTEKLPASNLVFLIDVSGSMMDENKLPLVKQSLRLLVDQLREQDRVSMVVYAGNAGLVLEPTSGSKKAEITRAIEALEAGGSTAGGQGLRLAYKTAADHFIKEGNNRIILCTDGDFNVGESSNEAMEKLIVTEREKGIFLSVLGFGMGNYKDSKMQLLADKGNGNHSYIDGIAEAKKVFVNEFGGTLFTIAKDVKLQVEFNPAMVQGYRLIGYENRLLNKEDFNDDKKDAGELGSGHTVTALYEIIPAGISSPFIKSVDKLKYQEEEEEEAIKQPASSDWLTVKFRYKEPAGSKSRLLEVAMDSKTVRFEKASENLRFASMSAAFSMMLRNSEFVKGFTYSNIQQLASAAVGTDAEGYRKEFVKLVQTASSISSSNAGK